MATGIELLILLLELLKTQKIFPPKYEMIQKLYNINNNFPILLTTLINICFSKNIKQVYMNYPSSDTGKISAVGLEQINEKIQKMISYLDCFEFPNKKIFPDNSDLKNYHFKKQRTFDDLKSINVFPKEFIIRHITETYGNICVLVLTLGWIIGGS